MIPRNSGIRPGGFLKAAAVVAGLCLAFQMLIGFGPLIRIITEPDSKTVEKTSDQAKLAKIALEAGDGSVREKAVEKINDQALLAKFALGSDFAVHRVATEKLTDQTPLAKIAVEDKNCFVRKAATKKLTDQAVLSKIALEDKDWLTRVAAVEKLADQSLLAKIAWQDSDSGVRRAAVDKLTDQSMLAKIAVKSEDRIIRYDSIRKIISQEHLAEVAIEATDYSVTTYAVEKLNDQALLAKIAVEGNGSALEKLSDSVLLLKVAFEGDGTQYAAFCKLRNAIDEVAALSTEAKDPVTRLHASIFLEIHGALQSLPDKLISGDSLRKQLCQMALLAANLLENPCIKAELGNIEDVQFKWEPCSVGYERLGEVRGEKVTLSIKASKVEQPIVHSWATIFPRRLEWRVSPNFNAEEYKDKHTIRVKVEELAYFRDLCGLLSAPALGRVASEARASEIRLAAVEKLTDSVILTKISTEDESSRVKEAAKKRLAEIQASPRSNPKEAAQ